MFRRPSSALLRILPLAAALACSAPLGAQLTEGILSPAGRLRLELSPEFDLWNRRYGPNGVEPLGYDLEHTPLSLAPLQQGLRTAVGDPSLPVALGSMRALVSRDRTRLALGGALGVFDWLTVGATVPLVKARTEVTADFRDAGVGLNPRLSGGAGTVGTFLSDLASSRAALATQVTQRCPASPDCAALTDLLGRYTTFTNGLRSAYEGSPVFVTAASGAGAVLQARLTSLKTEVAQRAPSVPLPGAAPLATPLDQAGLQTLLTDAGYGYQLVNPLQTTAAPKFALGDAEVSVAVRVLEGTVRDAAGGSDRFRYLVGAQGLVRLPTGTTDNPDNPLDMGTGDGQTDIEGGAFGDVRWTRLGVRAEARYGVQRPTELVRRVAPPEVVFAPLVTQQTVRWTPGRYLSLEAAPSWYIADEFAVGATYRLWSKQADTYRLVGSTQDDEASVLAQETEETLHELGLGLAFSTLDGWREGCASLPFELRVMIRRGVAGGGGAAPKGTRMEATGRVFWRIWGAATNR